MYRRADDVVIVRQKVCGRMEGGNGRLPCTTGPNWASGKSGPSTRHAISYIIFRHVNIRRLLIVCKSATANVSIRDQVFGCAASPSEVLSLTTAVVHVHPYDTQPTTTNDFHSVGELKFS